MSTIVKPEAFLYCWTDNGSSKLYVGVHKGRVDDGYVCSSKTMLEQYELRKKDFSREIIATGYYSDMIALETAILKNTNAAKSSFFYNMHNGDGNFYCKFHTQETKAIISKKLSGRIKTDSERKNISQAKKGITPKCVFTRRSYAGENNPNFGKSNKNIHLKTYDIEGRLFEGAESVVQHYGLKSVEQVYYRVCSNIEKWKNWNEVGIKKPFISKQKIKRPDLRIRNMVNNPAKSLEARKKISESRKLYFKRKESSVGN